MKFNKAKCKILHLGRGTPKYKYSLGREWIKCSPGERDLGLLVDESLNMSQQCVLAAQKANCVLAASKEVWQQGEGGDFPPLFWFGETPSEVVHPALEPPVQERCGSVEASPGEATKMIRGLEHLSYEDRLRQLGLVQPGEGFGETFIAPSSP